MGGLKGGSMGGLGERCANFYRRGGAASCLAGLDAFGGFWECWWVTLGQLPTDSEISLGDTLDKKKPLSVQKETPKRLATKKETPKRAKKRNP